MTKFACPCETLAGLVHAACQNRRRPTFMALTMLASTVGVNCADDKKLERLMAEIGLGVKGFKTPIDDPIVFATANFGAARLGEQNIVTYFGIAKNTKFDVDAVVDKDYDVGTSVLAALKMHGLDGPAVVAIADFTASSLTPELDTGDAIAIIKQLGADTKRLDISTGRREILASALTIARLASLPESAAYVKGVFGAADHSAIDQLWPEIVAHTGAAVVEAFVADQAMHGEGERTTA